MMNEARKIATTDTDSVLDIGPPSLTPVHQASNRVTVLPTSSSLRLHRCHLRKRKATLEKPRASGGVARAGNPWPCGLRAGFAVSALRFLIRDTQHRAGAQVSAACAVEIGGDYPGVMPGWITSGPPRRDLTPPSPDHPLSPLLARFGSISCFRVASWRNCGPFSLVSFQPVQRGTLTPARQSRRRRGVAPDCPGPRSVLAPRVAALVRAHGAGRA